jgi:hypothetical protein
MSTVSGRTRQDAFHTCIFRSLAGTSPGWSGRLFAHAQNVNHLCMSRRDKLISCAAVRKACKGRILGEASCSYVAHSILSKSMSLIMEMRPTALIDIWMS